MTTKKMPELPEVHTTATILNTLLPKLTIIDVWTDYGGKFHAGKKNIKDATFFARFKKEVVGQKIESVTRRGKNVLIHIGNGKTILVHMKMTGHLLYGFYKRCPVIPVKTGEERIPEAPQDLEHSVSESERCTDPVRIQKVTWEAVDVGPLQDSFNQFIHLVFSFSNKKHLALSDVRKFAKVTFFDTVEIQNVPDLKDLGPEPVHEKFTYEEFEERLFLKPKKKVKTVLMDQEVVAGIGNIYSDEILWATDIHPESRVEKIPKLKIKEMFIAMKSILKKGIDFGGDSTSDYRNPHGARGAFQYHHKAYRNRGKKCEKRKCGGTIERKIVGGRSAHFCSKHQHLY